MSFFSRSFASARSSQLEPLKNPLQITVTKKGRVIEKKTLHATPIHIGKEKSSQVVLNGSSVSKNHAQLKFNEGAWILEDLSSMSGTFVNNERIFDYGSLTEKDVIRIGDFTLQLQEITRDLSEKRVEFGSTTLAPQPASIKEKQQLHTTEGWTQSNNQTPPPNTHNTTQENVQSESYAGNDDAESSYANLSTADFSQWREKLHDEVVNTFDLRRQDISKLSEDNLREMTTEAAQELLKQWHNELPTTFKPSDLLQAVIDDIVGLGPLEMLLKDSGVSEIMVNSASEIFIEKGGRIQRSPFSFANDQAVLAVIDRIITPLGRRIDHSSPMVDARLKDGSRVNAIIPPLAIKGPCITIRKFPSKRLEIEDLIGFGSMNADMAEFFKVAVAEGKNVLVSGGTGTGKTTLLNVLSNQIPFQERVITIEDAAELQLNQPDLVSLEAKPANMEGTGAITIRDLVKNALRMRPNRIVVGECRGAEALDMLQAMNTGHDGSLTTLHANTPRDALSRLEVMVMMAGMDIPVQAIREQITSAIHIIVQQTRFPCGSRKVTHVSEVVGMESGIIQLQDIFLYKRLGITDAGKVAGQFKPTGLIPSFYEELALFGKKLDTGIYVGEHNAQDSEKTAGAF